MNRRSFIKHTAVAAAAVNLAGPLGLAAAQTSLGKNPLPRWRGFNLTDFNSPNPAWPRRGGTTDDDLKWMVDWGFDFIRLPMAYPRYIDFDR